MSDTMTKEEKLELKEEQAELKSALDVSSAQNRNLLIFFLAFMLYMTMILFQTTDLMILLPDTFGLTLPILGIEIPVLGFYIIAPVLVYLFYFNILHNLHQHHFKLEKWMPHFIENQSLKLFPFIYNDQSGNYESIVGIMMRLVYYVFPLFLLFGIFVRLFCYQSIALIMWHFLWLVAGLWLIKFFPPEAVYFNSNQKGLGKWLFSSSSIIFSLIFFVLVFPGPSEFGRRNVIKSFAGGIDSIRSFIGYARNNPIYRIYTPGLNFNELYQSHKNKLSGQGKSYFDLSGRSLININFSGATFCGLNQSKNCYVQFDGGTDLRYADFRGANIIGLKFYVDKIKEENIFNATQENSERNFADLGSVNFRGVNLQTVDLDSDKIKQIHLSYTWLKASDINQSLLSEFKDKYNNFETHRDGSKNLKFLCLDYLHFSHAVYHSEKPNEILSKKIVENLEECPVESRNFLSKKEWNYNKDQERRKTLFTAIKKSPELTK